jgi:tetratricopeptide (TPR) repeat protein
MDINDLEQVLRRNISPEHHRYIPLFAKLIVEIANGANPDSDVVAQFSDPSYQALLLQLAGRSIEATDSVISFGQDSQLGDVTVRDVAGRDVTNFSLSVVNTPAITQMRPPAQLRPPVPDFTGRAQEIQLLAATLRKAITTGAVAAISGVRGMGGIGKTEFAYALAWQLRDDFPDGQIVVELRGTTNPIASEQALQSILAAFESGINMPNDFTQLQGLYQSKLQGKRLLILADDARDASQTRPLMPPPNCALIVTTRNRFILPGMIHLDLDMLSSEAAEELIRVICPRIGAYAPRLAALCGYLPLALRISAEMLEADDTRNVERYLARLEQERLRHLRDPDSLEDPHASVEASLRLSYKALPPSSQQALAQLGVFSGSFDVEAARAVVVIDDDVEDALGLLRRRSLIYWDEGVGRYHLHDLVRAFALAQLGEPTAIIRYISHYAAVGRNITQLHEVGGGGLRTALSMFDGERLQIEASFARLEQWVDKREVAPILISYMDLFVTIGQLRYPLQELCRRLESGLIAARLLNRRDLEAKYIHGMGLWTSWLKEYPPAIKLLSQALAIAEEIGDVSQQTVSLLTLGGVHGNIGEFVVGVQLLERALAMARVSGNRVREGQALDNLGIIFGQQGDVARSSSYYTESLVVKREVGDIRGEGRVLGGLGECALVQGDFNKGINLLTQSFMILNSLEDRIDAGDSALAIGKGQSKQGQMVTAIEWLQIAVNLFQEAGLTNDVIEVTVELEHLRQLLASTSPRVEGER